MPSSWRTNEEVIPLRRKDEEDNEKTSKDGEKKSTDIGVDYNFGFDWKLIKRCQRIYAIALPPIWSWDGFFVFLLLINIFPPMGTQFLFALLPGWTMRTLIDRNLPDFASSMFATACVGLLDAFLSGLNFWLALYVSIRLRKRLTENMHTRYCNYKMLFYQMAMTDVKIDNPDARIQTDAAQATVGLVTVLAILVSGTLQVFIYTAFVTYKVGWTGTIIIYAYYLVTALVNKLMMSPIVALTYNQDRLEGHFRFEHARLRTMAEAVAFSSGHDEAKTSLELHLARVLKNQTKNIMWQSWLNLFTNVIGNGNAILGYCIAAYSIFTLPQYSKKNETDSGSLGEVITQLTAVIGNLTAAFSSLINAAPLAASMAGNTSRVGQMLEAMDEMERKWDAYHTRHIGSEPNKGALVTFQNVTAALPSGRLFVRNFSLDVFPGINVVIRGPSGCGKTSLLRLLKGLWYLDEHSGRVVCTLKHGTGGIMFLPQRPFFFNGNLQEQIEYPRDPNAPPSTPWDSLPSVEWERALFDLRLSHLKGDGWNGKNREYQDFLSLGEMQALAIVRVLHHRPQVVCLDESTSAMSDEMEATCFRLLSEAGVEMGITCLSVAHRPSVIKHHKIIVTLEGGGGWKATPVMHDESAMMASDAQL